MLPPASRESREEQRNEDDQSDTAGIPQQLVVSVVSFPSESQAALLALIDAEPANDEQRTGVQEWLGRLCRAAQRALPASGVGLSLIASSGAQALSVASSSVSEVVEELQFVLGEGPCRDAYAARQPVLAADLSLDTRWPAYSAAARNEGVEAVFAFPLHIGSACLGILDVYQDRPGLLAPNTITQAVIFAEVAIMTILEDPHEGGADEALFEADDGETNRLELYQAQGMVTVQLGVGLSEAMARLRAYAFANDRRLRDVAYDIVTRKLSLEKDDQ